MTILDLHREEAFRIQGVTLPKEIGKRLADMGFTRGTIGHFVRCALLGDPMQIRIMNYDVSIRKSEAAGIEVERV